MLPALQVRVPFRKQPGGGEPSAAPYLIGYGERRRDPHAAADILSLIRQQRRAA